MDKLNDKIVKHFKNLIKEGNEIIELASTSEEWLPFKYTVKINSWITQCGQIIKKICEYNDIYFEHYKSAVEDADMQHFYKYNYSHLSVILGCIEGVYADYKKGLLNDVRNILRAEIFGDFLEMGEHLLNEGYKDAAAVIIGSVLEDTLRKLAVQNRISIEKNNGQLKTTEPLNQELGKKEVYNKLIQKQITSWGDLRNKAAHGHYNEYNKEQVQMMLLFVQQFCSDYIT